MQFDVRYYLVAILFIIFDLEIAFLFPWEGTKKTKASDSARSAMHTNSALTVESSKRWG